MKRQQRGFSLLGFLFVGGVLAVTGVIAAQVFPTLLEYQAITKAVNKASTSASVVEARKTYEAATAIDDIKSVGPKDLEIVKDGDKLVISFSYQREIHLVGPAWLTLKYAGRSK